jgi:hypothetical protein
MRFLSSGKLNRAIGWLLLVVALACAAWLEPWSFGERNPADLVNSAKTAVIVAQTIALVMAFLQLAIAETLTLASPLTVRRGSFACLAGLGGVLIAAGYAAEIRHPGAAWLIPTGAVMSLMGFVTFIKDARGNRDLKTIILVLCFGMLLVGIMGMFELRPESFLPAYLGPEDGFRLRMLRLARIALIALSVLTLLYLTLVQHADPQSPTARWGRLGMLCGMIGIPAILVAAGFGYVGLKMLLPIPALAILAGTLCGAQLAKQANRSLELYGWLLIALGMAGGLIMGFYAFDAPFSPFGFVGLYNSYGRRLIRLAHIDCIVFGLTSIFIARELAKETRFDWSQRLGVALLIAGSATTIVILLILAQTNLSVTIMSIGPTMVTAALLFCLTPNVMRALPSIVPDRRLFKKSLKNFLQAAQKDFRGEAREKSILRPCSGQAPLRSPVGWVERSDTHHSSLERGD